MNYSAYDEHGVFVVELALPSFEDAQNTAKLMGAVGLIEGDHDPASQWYDRAAEQVRQREPMAIAVQGSSLVGVPAGATIQVDDQTYVADGSEVQLSFEHTGRFHIKVSLPTFLPFETDIDHADSP